MALESIVGIGSIVDDGVVGSIGVNSRPPDVQLWNAQSVLDYHTFQSLFAITVSARWSEHNQWLTITPKKPLLIKSPPVSFGAMPMSLGNTFSQDVPIGCPGTSPLDILGPPYVMSWDISM